MDRIQQNFVYTLSLTQSVSRLLRAISFSNRVLPLNISLSSDSGMVAYSQLL